MLISIITCCLFCWLGNVDNCRIVSPWNLIGVWYTALLKTVWTLDWVSLVFASHCINASSVPNYVRCSDRVRVTVRAWVRWSFIELYLWCPVELFMWCGAKTKESLVYTLVYLTVICCYTCTVHICVYFCYFSDEHRGYQWKWWAFVCMLYY